MKRILFACIICALLFVSNSYAEDDKPLSGSLFLGGRALSMNHESANFNKYNGITPGLFGGGNAGYDMGAYHLWAGGAYLGEDDFYFKMKGGRWGAFKYSLYFTEFPANHTFKASTLYVNPGSDNLTFNGNGASAGVTDLTRWGSRSFDYKVRRQDFGGSFDLSAVRPFFFSVDGNQLRREGQMPWSGTSGQATFKAIEMPLPVDNTTRNLNALAGWKNKKFYAAFGGGYSWFYNDVEFTRFRDPFTTATSGPLATSFGTTVGPPDNQSWYVNFTGTAKLPLSSVFALNAGYQKNTSSTTILNSIDSSTGPVALALNRSTFHGDVEYWSFGGTLTSNPVKNLDTKLYYKYYADRNNSDGVVFTAPSRPTTVPVSSERFDYMKTTVGGEASYRFLRQLKGILGYEFADVHRKEAEFEAGDISTEEGETGFHGNRGHIPETWDHKITGQLLYNPIEQLGLRFKYQKLYRNVDFRRSGPATTALNDVLNAELANNMRRFDVGNKEQDMFKFSGDFSPLRNLDLTLEYAYKKDDYYKSLLGYQERKSNEFILDTTYEWKGIKLFGFFDYETGYTQQNSRFATPTATPAPSGNPGAAPNVNSFNWDVKLDNDNYAYGIGTAIPILKNKLSFVVQYDFEKNNGDADFTSQAFTAAHVALGLNNNLIDIPAWDDYTRQNISTRLLYDMTKNFGLVFGHVYSQFKWNDGQFKAYSLVPAGTNLLLSGAYTDQSYNANLYYIKAVFKF